LTRREREIRGFAILSELLAKVGDQDEMNRFYTEYDNVYDDVYGDGNNGNGNMTEGLERFAVELARCYRRATHPERGEAHVGQDDAIEHYRDLLRRRLDAGNRAALTRYTRRGIEIISTGTK
jgi:hypothetical protein